MLGCAKVTVKANDHHTEPALTAASPGEFLKPNTTQVWDLHPGDSRLGGSEEPFSLEGFPVAACVQSSLLTTLLVSYSEPCYYRFKKKSSLYSE